MTIQLGEIVNTKPEGEPSRPGVFLGYTARTRNLVILRCGDETVQLNINYVEQLGSVTIDEGAAIWRRQYLQQNPGGLSPLPIDMEPLKAPPAPEDTAVEEAPTLPRSQVSSKPEEIDLPGSYEPVTAQEFAAWRKLMKVSKTKAAEMIGVSRNMPARYEEGTAEVPLTVALACAALARGLKPWPL